MIRTRKNGSAKIRVLIVEDSAVMRKLLTALLEADGEIEVIATAPDAEIAREKLVGLRPDVMTLDLQLPGMDGVSFLEKVMQHFPTRTLVISQHAGEGSEAALKAGALAVMAKPSIESQDDWRRASEAFTQKIKSLCKTRIAQNPQIEREQAPVKSAPSAIQLIAMAASTGGTEALKEVLRALPEDLPGIVIVQHMPPYFTQTFAQNLNRVCRLRVKEASDGDRVEAGLALLAPGDFHMELVKRGSLLSVRLHQAPPLHGVRPAADFLLKSVAKIMGSQALGLILTGMGRDGAEGLLAMHKAGAHTIAQDELSSVVYGMPKAALALGAVDEVLPLHRIGASILTTVLK